MHATGKTGADRVTESRFWQAAADEGDGSRPWLATGVLARSVRLRTWRGRTRLVSCEERRRIRRSERRVVGMEPCTGGERRASAEGWVCSVCMATVDGEEKRVADANFDGMRIALESGGIRWLSACISRNHHAPHPASNSNKNKFRKRAQDVLVGSRRVQRGVSSREEEFLGVCLGRFSCCIDSGSAPGMAGDF